ncbi:VCBS repeat-containing protein [Foetidibacter luteolus]|uniref:VCBS repeat-containing protein n=1 Tax=Foetidibacter luteolus TaxID=2608880 RepID=UPI00129A6372|nr:VCBS repeat-containing protein [Foetidibacter luteolus]
MKLSIVMFCAAVWLCNPVKTIAQQPLFQLLNGSETGITFSNNINETENLNVLAYEYFYNGGGVAVGDVNNDGLEDVFFTANMGENKLYLNQGSLKFKDITKETGRELQGRKGGWKTGVTMADVNGDGLLDIYICYSGKVDADTRRNQLFINQGNLKFTEKAKEYGLDDPGYGTKAVFFDMDNDGDLDMFLLNHNVIKVSNLELAKYRGDVDELAGDKLFENKGSRFEDVSKKAGIHQNPLTFGLGVATADINQDGWQDIYVTNDYTEQDYIYINNKNGTFSDKTKDCFRHLAQFSMGVDIADFNNDALPDILTLDMLPEDNRRQKLLQLQENYEIYQLMIDQDLQKQYMRNMLQLNNGDGTFSEIAQVAGISNTDWSWAPLFADFDNDGYKDLFVTNGYLRDYTNKDFLKYWGDYKVRKVVDREPIQLMDLIKAMPVTRYPNYIFRNNHDLTFSNKQKEWGFEQPKISSGAVFADLDKDGDLDLIINNINQEAFVYRNNSREQNNSAYLSLRLKNNTPNTAALGAKAYLYAGGMVQYQEVNPNRGYLSSVSTLLHFGLGNMQKIDSVKIVWPDQSSQLLTAVQTNQLLEVEKQGNAPAAAVEATAGKSYFTPAPAIIEYKHEEFTENDFKRQLLMLFMYSKTAPIMAKGDINKDGLDDIFISGDKNKAGKIYLQQAGGKFAPLDLNFVDENVSTVAAAAFFDANGDGWQDLYLAKGGYALWEPGMAALQDELYLSDGKGGFVYDQSYLPDLTANSKSCIKPCDYDNDGDLDLFIGGRVVPGKYPVAPISYLLTNDGKGHFTATPAAFNQVGMVTDAHWADLNNDGRKDLVLCGEFMPVKVFINLPGGFEDRTTEYFDKPDNGFWFAMQFADVNGDGRQDIIAGNLGLNSQVQVSDKQPGELYFADFDDNGSIDPFFNFYVQGKSYPFVSRDELNEQIYPMRKKFTSYKDYADATMQQLFSEAELSKAGKLTVAENRTVCYLNRGGKFVKTLLPLQAQFSMVTKIITNDFTGDGKTDVLLLGNHTDNRLKLGSIDANYGCLLAGDGKGGFTYVSQPVSGLSIKGDVKSAEELNINGSKYLAVGISNTGLVFYKQGK